jgi:hypothetical protein
MDALRDPQMRAAAAPTPPLSAAPVLRAPLLPSVRRLHPRPTDWAAVARRIGSPPLPAAFTLLLLAISAFWTLICARGWQAPPAGDLRLALDIQWRVPLTIETHLSLFAAVIVVMVVGWLATWRAVGASGVGLRGVLVGAVVLGAPFLLLTGIYSDDVYLYHFYGRELAHYGANPFTTPPSAFEGDPHLRWVYWKWLPSAYGPLWLSISAPLSALAGESIAAAVVLYRVAGLAAHLLASGLIYGALRGIRRDHAVPAAAFYAWNPFVLFESVASAHNDALVVAFLCGVLWAFVRSRWVQCGVLMGCAVMVKPFAALAAIPLAAALWGHSPPDRRLARLAAGVAAGGLTMAALYLPFGAGDALLRNIVANPASGTYMNSPWELLAVQFGGWSGPMRTWIQSVWLDPLRVALLTMSVLAAAVASLRTGRFVPGMIVLWLGFCTSQAWIWPWYFLPLVAMASFAGPRTQRLAVALSLGGMLFYLAWPPPPKSLAWIHTWRSLLLFGPAFAVLLVEGCALALSRHRKPRATDQHGSTRKEALATSNSQSQPLIETTQY